MKQRILTGWSLARVLYLLLGMYVMVVTAMEQHWLGVLLGGYFAAMGIFRFGCAAGNCYTNVPSGSAIEPTKEFDVIYDEVK